MASKSIKKKEETSITYQEMQQERLKTIEDNLYENSLAVVNGACEFAELDIDNIDAVPQKWIDEMGLEKAKRRHRLAKVGWMRSSDAPVAINTATKIVVGIVRARATEKAGPRQLNLNMITMTIPPPEYGVIDVESESGE